MRRVNLPGGAWADLRDKDEVTTRDRRRIRAMGAGLTTALPRIQGVTADTDITELDITEDEMDLFFRLQEVIVLAFIAAWSLPDPPTETAIGDLPVNIYDALSELTAQDGAVIAGATATAQPTGNGEHPDPKASSGGSKSSASPSKGSPPRTPTRKSGKRGTPTSTGN